MENPTAGLACLTGPAFWVFVLPLSVLMIRLTYRSIVRWKSRQYLRGAHPRPLGATVYSTVFNPVRRRLGIRPLRVIPYVDDAHRHEVDMLERADRLLRQIRASLKHTPINTARKATLEWQAREVPDNIVKALWTLARLRRIRESIDPRFDRDGENSSQLAELQDELISEMMHSLEILSSIPVSLVRLELARGDSAVDKVLVELDETNRRLLDMSASYAEIRAISALGSP